MTDSNRTHAPRQLELFPAEGKRRYPDPRIGYRAAEAVKESIIAAYVAGDTPVEIAKRLSVGAHSVRSLLVREGVHIRNASESKKGKPLKQIRRIRRLDESVFDVINEESAAWIGLLMADGCVSHRAKAQPSISLGLQERDAEHVRLFRDFLRCDHKISISRSKPHRSPDGTYVIWQSQPSHRLSVNSQRLADALSRHGVVPRKSLTARPSDELATNRHYFRGLLDGDGGVYWYTHNEKMYPSVFLCGSRDNIEAFRAFARVTCPEAKGNVYPVRSIWTYKITGECAKILAEHIYADCKVALARKAAVVREFADWQPTNPRIPSDIGAEIFRLAATGAQWEDIAEAVGRSVAGVKLYYRRAGGEPRRTAKKFTAAEDAIICEMIASASSAAEIARRLDRHPGSIRSRISHMGIA